MPNNQALPDKGPLPGVKGSSPPGELPMVQPAVPPVEPDPSQLTPEEQMARFAKELKENDWGHQPC
jgi:hypothetical protein